MDIYFCPFFIIGEEIDLQNIQYLLVPFFQLLCINKIYTTNDKDLLNY